MCYMEEIGWIPEPNAPNASKKHQKSDRRFGTWTGRFGTDVGEEVSTVKLSGPKIVIVEALRGFPFNCAGTSVHTPQVVRVQGSYLTFPFLRPLGGSEYMYMSDALHRCGGICGRAGA